MTHKKSFWMAQMIGLLAFYAFAAWQIQQGNSAHQSVMVAGIVLGLHVLEIPVAFLMLKGRNAQPLRVFGNTLVFGLLWWVPARKGLFAVR